MLMFKHNSAQPRPYWHVDAKWISGILLFFSLSACLLFYNLSNLTVRDTAVKLSASVMASLFSKNGLDDEANAAGLRQQVTQSASETVMPIPQFPTITLTKQQVASLSARDLQLAIFSQITGPIYDQGLSIAAATFTNDAQQRDSFIQQAAPLGFLTASTHDALQKLFLFSGLISILLLAAVIFYSAGWGRLVSPGVILLLASPLGSLIGLGLTLMPKNSPSSPITTLPVGIADTLGTSLTHSYLYAAGVGSTLLLIAIIGKIVSLFTKKPPVLTP